MKSPKRFLFLSVLLLMTLLLSACSGGNKTEQTQSGSGGQEPVSEEATPEEAVADEAAAEEAPVEAGAGEPTVEAETGSEGLTGGVPEDVPIMEGNYELQVTPDGGNLSYKIDAEHEDVVAFYQAELEKLGWEMTRSPDNVVGAMATMGRTNENGDRVTLNLQYNPVGKFTVVRIVVLRDE
jgi:hypothetical protein